MTDSVFFIKMQGLGNDFIIIDNRQNQQTIHPDKMHLIADRRTGVGCDQVIVILSSKVADAKMMIYNNDGSIAETCGNATRCVGKILFSENPKKKFFNLESGNRIMNVTKDGEMLSVDMGEPEFNASLIPLADASLDTIALPIEYADFKDPVAVNMGNPHIVFFADDIDGFNLPEVGSYFETHALFPDKTNVSFVQVLAADKLRARVWERGTGATLACGTAACAVAVAARRRGFGNETITVEMPGGDLQITWRAKDNHVIMAGPAREVFIGKFDWKLFN